MYIAYFASNYLTRFQLTVQDPSLLKLSQSARVLSFQQNIEYKTSTKPMKHVTRRPIIYQGNFATQIQLFHHLSYLIG